MAAMTNNILPGSGSGFGLTKIHTPSGGGGSGVACSVLDGETVQLSCSGFDVVDDDDDEGSAVASEPVADTQLLYDEN